MYIYFHSCTSEIIFSNSGSTKEKGKIGWNPVYHKNCWFFEFNCTRRHTVEMGLRRWIHKRWKVKPSQLALMIFKSKQFPCCRYFKRKSLFFVNTLSRPEKCTRSRKFAKVCPHNSPYQAMDLHQGFFFSEMCGGQKGYCHVHGKAKFTTNRFSRVKF